MRTVLGIWQILQECTLSLLTMDGDSDPWCVYSSFKFVKCFLSRVIYTWVCVLSNHFSFQELSSSVKWASDSMEGTEDLKLATSDQVQTLTLLLIPICVPVAA